MSTPAESDAPLPDANRTDDESPDLNDLRPTQTADQGVSASSTAGEGPDGMDPAVKSIQPGGGVVMSIELAWGRVRRWYLRTFCRAYVAKMKETRRGEAGDLPFEPVDARDVKFFRNQPTYHWDPVDDPHHWREGLPFVRVGLAELFVLGGGSFLLAIALGWLWWPLGWGMLVVTGLIVWFFRDPQRAISKISGSVVSPADGKLVQIEAIQDPDLGPCLQFGIFLSIFNVHANRASLPGKVVSIRYRPGKFLNALKPESARENENLDLVLEINAAEFKPRGGSDPAAPDGEDAGRVPRRCRIRQITGQFARRIVCWAKPGDVLERGEMFGMIKLGSRTELIIPADPDLRVIAEVGQKIVAGNTVLARYE